MMGAPWAFLILVTMITGHGKTHFVAHSGDRPFAEVAECGAAVHQAVKFIVSSHRKSKLSIESSCFQVSTKGI